MSDILETLPTGHLGKVDPDLDWMSLAVKLPTQGRRRTPGATLSFIPAIPFEFLRGILPAGDAIPVLLVALAKMRMQGISEIPIGAGIWKEVGDPGKRARSRLLKQIATVSDEICTVVHRKGRPALLKTGSRWPAGRG